MGSGTTAEVALRLGRNVIGFEMLEEYCEIIQERLEAVGKELKKKKTQPSIKSSLKKAESSDEMPETKRKKQK